MFAHQGTISNFRMVSRILRINKPPPGKKNIFRDLFKEREEVRLISGAFELARALPAPFRLVSAQFDNRRRSDLYSPTPG